MINDQVGDYLSDKVVPKGLARLYGPYKGKNEMSDLYRKLYLLVQELPKLKYASMLPALGSQLPKVTFLSLQYTVFSKAYV